MCNQGSSCCWWIIIAIIILFLLCGNCGSWGCGCGNNNNNNGCGCLGPRPGDKICTFIRGGACKAPPLKLFLDNGLFCTIIRNICCATLVI